MNLHSDSLWLGVLIKERIEGIAPAYPCVAGENAPSEYCVYRRTGFSSRRTKDIAAYEERLEFVVSAVAPSYIRSLEIAQGIKDSLDGLRGAWRGKMVDSLEMTSALEEYAGTMYVQHLYFTLVIDPEF